MFGPFTLCVDRDGTFSLSLISPDSLVDFSPYGEFFKMEQAVFSTMNYMPVPMQYARTVHVEE